MTEYQLHQDGDCNSYTCELCVWEDAQVMAAMRELVEPDEWDPAW